jgi:transcriptional regulator with XRE-family HTH domain
VNHTEVLSERVRYFRKLHKLTQKDLARHLGVAPRYIGNIEQGNRLPSLDMLIEMCRWFDIDVSDILPIKANRTEKDSMINEIMDVLKEWDSQQIALLKAMVTSMNS